MSCSPTPSPSSLLEIDNWSDSTGGSGYIGGSILHSLVKTFPHLEVTALVRNEEKAAKITAAHPDVKIAIGDFNSKEVIERAAEESNIVIRTSSLSSSPSEQG